MDYEERDSHSYVAKLSMANEVNRSVKRTVCQIPIIPIRVDKSCQYTHGPPRDLPVRGVGYEPSTC